MNIEILTYNIFKDHMINGKFKEKTIEEKNIFLNHAIDEIEKISLEEQREIFNNSNIDIIDAMNKYIKKYNQFPCYTGLILEQIIQNKN